MFVFKIIIGRLTLIHSQDACKLRRKMMMRSTICFGNQTLFTWAILKLQKVINRLGTLVEQLYNTLIMISSMLREFRTMIFTLWEKR